MERYYGSIRNAVERAFAGVIFGAAALLVVSGTFAMCFGGGPLVA